MSAIYIKRNMLSNSGISAVLMVNTHIRCENVTLASALLISVHTCLQTNSVLKTWFRIHSIRSQYVS